MAMRMLDLIAKKREGAVHSPDELEFIVQAAAGEGVPDYQISAWLMAVCLKGMKDSETIALTRAMASSGKPLHLSKLPFPIADKHSTGGVGDGISIALAPLVAAAGVAVPMMSGRGLGHTGGTLDKLESIPGFKVRRSMGEIERQLEKIGVCMFGQTAELAPADRKLYALRDATSTVESLPLIVSSILSKKIAEDLNGLVLDIKCGSGAIFKEESKAYVLGKALVATAKKMGLRCVGLVTGMDQPLGRAIGNAVEVKQAVEVLQGDRAAGDYVELLLALGGWMVHLAGKARKWEDGARLLEDAIKNGKALQKFREMVRAQGGDERVVDEPHSILPQAAKRLSIRASRSGFVSRMDARGVGVAAVALGAGRNRMEDPIDFGAGILLHKKVGDSVARGEEIASLFASDSVHLENGEKIFKACVDISAKKKAVQRLIRKVLK